MTVCIVARCGGALFGAADRMLTGGDIQFEPPVPKIHSVSNSLVILTAGDSSFHAEVLDGIHPIVQGAIDRDRARWFPVRELVDVYVQQRNLAKLKRAEAALLAPLGLDRELYLSKQSAMAHDIAEQLARDMIGFQVPGISAIIAGVDASGPHIYVVEDGEVSCNDWISFASIGSGSRHALSQFMLARHSAMADIPETLLLTFIAKRRAEVAPGVGRGTDMFTIGPAAGSLTVLQPDVLKRLEAAYQRVVKSEERIQNRARKEIQGYVEELSKSAAQKKQTASQPEGEVRQPDGK